VAVYKNCRFVIDPKVAVKAVIPAGRKPESSSFKKTLDSRCLMHLLLVNRLPTVGALGTGMTL